MEATEYVYIFRDVAEDVLEVYATRDSAIVRATEAIGSTSASDEAKEQMVKDIMLTDVCCDGEIHITKYPVIK